MIAFLLAINDDVWDYVEEGYSAPAIVTDGKTIPKPKSQWTQGEKNFANWNNKEINSIYNGVTPIRFHKISTCSTGKEACDILQTVDEGIDTVKQTKIQNLTAAFKTLCIKKL